VTDSDSDGTLVYIDELNHHYYYTDLDLLMDLKLNGLIADKVLVGDISDDDSDDTDSDVGTDDTDSDAGIGDDTDEDLGDTDLEEDIFERFKNKYVEGKCP